MPSLTLLYKVRALRSSSKVLKILMNVTDEYARKQNFIDLNQMYCLWVLFGEAAKYLAAKDMYMEASVCCILQIVVDVQMFAWSAKPYMNKTFLSLHCKLAEQFCADVQHFTPRLDKVQEFKNAVTRANELLIEMKTAQITV